MKSSPKKYEITTGLYLIQGVTKNRYTAYPKILKMCQVLYKMYSENTEKAQFDNTF